MKSPGVGIDMMHFGVVLSPFNRALLLKRKKCHDRLPYGFKMLIVFRIVLFIESQWHSNII